MFFLDSPTNISLQFLLLSGLFIHLSSQPRIFCNDLKKNVADCFYVLGVVITLISLFRSSWVKIGNLPNCKNQSDTNIYEGEG